MSEDMLNPDLFWARVDRRGANECWPWTLLCDGGGYGKVNRKRYTGQPLYAHRVAFRLTHGRWPKGVVRHSCDNPPCCNPAHLAEGTYKDNSQDAVRRGRMRRGEGVHGALLTQNKADEIRRIYALGGVSQTALAKMFGVKQPTVSQVVRNVTWVS